MPPETDGDAAATSQAPAPTTPNVGDSAPAVETIGGNLSQDEVNRVVAQRVAEAQRIERKRILEQAGVPTLEALKDTLKAQRDAEESAKSDLERALTSARQEMEAAAAERQQLAKDRHDLIVQRTLAATGASGDLEKIARLVDVEIGADTAAVTAAVEQAKTDFPALFGAATATPAPSEPHGGGAPSRPSSSPDAKARGEARAELYNKGGRVSSF